MGSGRENMSGFSRQGALPGLSHPEAEEKGCLLSAWLSGGTVVAAGGGGGRGGNGSSGAVHSQVVARTPLDSASARPLFPASARTGRRARGRGRGQCERGNAGAWRWGFGGALVSPVLTPLVIP